MFGGDGSVTLPIVNLMLGDLYVLMDKQLIFFQERETFECLRGG